MSKEDAIYKLLTDDPAVGGAVSTRVYPMLLPEGEPLPAIIYQAISSVTDYSCDGPTGLRTSRYQITSWAASPETVRDLAEAVHNVFTGYSGTTAGTIFQVVFVSNLYDIPDLDIAGHRDRYGRGVDIELHTAD